MSQEAPAQQGEETSVSGGDFKVYLEREISTQLPLRLLERPRCGIGDGKNTITFAQRVAVPVLQAGSHHSRAGSHYVSFAQPGLRKQGNKKNSEPVLRQPALPPSSGQEILTT